MKHPIPILMALTLTVAGCSGSNSTNAVTTPAAPTVTETFPGTVSYQGVDFHTFNVAQSGTLNVTLTTAGPPPTIWMGVGIGTPSASACGLISNSTSTVTPAGVAAPQLTGTLAPGTYCVQVYDVGNLSPGGAVTYSVTVAHT
jgi:hypothetical protein